MIYTELSLSLFNIAGSWNNLIVSMFMRKNFWR